MIQVSCLICHRPRNITIEDSENRYTFVFPPLHDNSRQLYVVFNTFRERCLRIKGVLRILFIRSGKLFYL